MPFANNQGVKIHYEVEGQGPPLVLAHMAGGDIEQWRRWGWTSSLSGDYKLILVDQRGCGRSDKPHDVSAYNIGLRATDVTTILDDLGIEKAHYFGYSMGAIFEFRIAVMEPQRFSSFIFGGMSSYRSELVLKAAREGRDIELYQMRVDDPEKAFAMQEKFFGRLLTKEEKDTVLANDPRAQLASALAMRELRSLTDDELANITVPCLLFCGELDPRLPEVKQTCTRIPRGSFFLVPNLAHDEAFYKSAASLPQIKDFLKEVNKNP